MPEDPAQRDELVRDHLHLVDAYARNAFPDLPDWITPDEVRAAAREGLLDAAQRYEHGRGTRFSTYAYYRIRGAIFDHVRQLHQQDPARVARVLALARLDDLVAGRAADVAPPEGPLDAAAELATTLEAVAASLVLDEMGEATRGALHRDPETLAAAQELSSRVRDAVRALPDRESWMITKVYFDGLTLEEAGAGIGLTKSWACRLHARALTALRDDLRALADSD